VPPLAGDPAAVGGLRADDADWLARMSRTPLPRTKNECPTSACLPDRIVRFIPSLSTISPSAGPCSLQLASASFDSLAPGSHHGSSKMLPIEPSAPPFDASTEPWPPVSLTELPLIEKPPRAPTSLTEKALPVPSLLTEKVLPLPLEKPLQPPSSDAPLLPLRPPLTHALIATSIEKTVPLPTEALPIPTGVLPRDSLPASPPEQALIATSTTSELLECPCECA